MAHVSKILLDAGKIAERGKKEQHTGLLLLESHLVPVDLHAVPQLHPQLGLLLRGHGLPALLNTGECGIRDGMLGGGAGLLGSDRLLLSLRTSVQASHWARNGAVGAQARGGHSRAASSSASNGTKEHCVLRVCARIRVN